MTPAEDQATRHLFEYLDARHGDLVFAFERAYAPLAECVRTYAVSQAKRVRFVAVEQVAPDELHTLLSDAPKFVCAFNPTFQHGFSPAAQVMTERSTTLSLKAFTLRDVSHMWRELFAPSPRDIARLNEQLIRVLQDGQVLAVKSAHGTDLTISLSPEFLWVNMDGLSEADFDLTCNLPVGEVATFPARIDGTIHFTGALLGTIPIGRKYGAIRHPILFEISDGAVTRVESRDRGLERDLNFCLYLDDYTHTVNEVAFGTNPAIRGAMLGLNYKYEENRYGFHIGFGASLAQQNVTRQTPHHLDLVFDEVVATLDGVTLFDGEFRLNNFQRDISKRLRVAQRSCCGAAAATCPPPAQ
jgi:leucyl aminopeptidase (aminopeptidase T)